jgi:hypothetical protein
MIKIPSGIKINSLIWINSLDAKEQGTTERVHDVLQPYFVSIGLPFQSFEPKSAKELLAFLDQIAAAAARGLRPIIHLDTHGSATKGIFIAASGEFVSWKDLNDGLRPINVAMNNDLCIVSAACFSLQAIKQMTVQKPAPFFILIAPEETVTFGFIENNTTRFYEEVFKGNDVVAAHEKYLAPRLKLFHSEKMLAIILTRIIRDHLTGKGRRIRQEDLVTQVIKDGLPNTPENRKLARKVAKESARPTQQLIDRYTASFLMGKGEGIKIDDLIELAKKAKSAKKKIGRLPSKRLTKIPLPTSRSWVRQVAANMMATNWELRMRHSLLQYRRCGSPTLRNRRDKQTTTRKRYRYGCSRPPAS